jgi:hypothetical protein
VLSSIHGTAKNKTQQKGNRFFNFIKLIFKVCIPRTLNEIAIVPIPLFDITGLLDGKG